MKTSKISDFLGRTRCHGYLSSIAWHSSSGYLLSISVFLLFLIFRLIGQGEGLDKPLVSSVTSFQSSFQLIVESKDAIAIAIATPTDWLKNLAPIFQPIGSKTKPIRLVRVVFPAL